MNGAHLILERALDDTVAQSLGEGIGGFLGHRAELPHLAIASGQMEADGLAPSAFLERREPAGEALQVENGHADLDAPQAAVMRPQGVLQRANVVMTGDDRIDYDRRS